LAHPNRSRLVAIAARAVAVVVCGAAALYTAESLTIAADSLREWRLPPTYDRRTRLEVLDDLRAHGLDAIISPLSHAYLTGEPGARVSEFAVDGREFVPLGGVARKPSVVCNELGTYLIVEPDRFGFHNPDGVWQTSPMEIAAVGDSFAFGMCVPPAESLVGRIRHAHPATVNLGVISNGPLFELATVKEYLPALAPRLVLWFFFENDIEDIEYERRDALLMNYVRDDGFTQNLRMKQAEIDRQVLGLLARRERVARLRAADDARIATKTRSFLALSRIHTLLGDTRVSLFAPDARVLSDEAWTLFDQTLEKADGAVRAWGGRIHFVYLPTLRRFGTPIGVRLDFRAMLPKAYVDQLHIRVLDIARKHRFPITDLTDSFERHPNARRDLFSPVFHYSVEGNRLVADAVLADIPSTLNESTPPGHDDAR